MPHSDTLQDWLVSNRLYEGNLFYYALIILVWFFIGFSFLGFEIDGYSQSQNLFFNFVFYLFICAMMALCPFWFKLFFGKTHTAKREQELQQALDELDEYDRAEVKAELAHTGGLAVRPIQRWALVFLGSYFLFEVFFISAWVKDMALVWEPKWASVLIEWVRANTNLPPLNVDRKLFMLDIGLSSDKILHKMYKTEIEFLDSEFGKSVLLFHFMRFIAVPLIIIAICGVFFDIIRWNGLNKIESNAHIEDRFQFFKSYLWISFLSFFCTLMIIGGYIGLWSSIDTSAQMSVNITMWIDSLYLNFCLVLMIIAFFIIIAWLKMTKRLIFSLFGFSQ